MKQPIKAIFSVILVFVIAFTFIACDEDEKPTTTAGPTTAPSTTLEPTEDPTTKPVDDPTTAPTTTPVEDSTTAPTTAPVDDPTTAPITTAPSEDPSTAEPTKAPVTTAPPEDPTTAEPTKAPVTTAPVEDTTKAPVTTAPIEDPSVDYSKWGNYGFESLLPAPLPFSEVTNWISRKYAGNTYEIMNASSLDTSKAEQYKKMLEDYVRSLESYGYTFDVEADRFSALKENDVFHFIYAEGFVFVSFTIR